MTEATTDGATGTDTEADVPAVERLSWPARAVALLGWVVVAVGAFGASGHITTFTGSIPWMQLAKWLVGAALLHDLVIGPIVGLVGLVIGRVLPVSVRAPVAVGLIVSGALVAVSYPRLRGYGRLSTNPSIIPGDAAHDLLTVLSLVWVVVALALVVRVVGRVAHRT